MTCSVNIFYTRQETGVGVRFITKLSLRMYEYCIVSILTGSQSSVIQQKKVGSGQFFSWPTGSWPSKFLAVHGYNLNKADG